MTETADILLERRGALGLVTLNRPQALNAVTIGMVRALHPKLEEWAADPTIQAVAIRGAGERAFSAGGDIRQIWEQGMAGRQAEALAFWREEYVLNTYIKAYPKPYVALIDGIVMGGGVGLSVHGSHRVVGEKLGFAMPEVGIGFFPDVGATWFLPRLPGRTGWWLGLTGTRIKTADAVALGIATHHAPRAAFDAIIEALAMGQGVDEVLAAYAADPGPAPVEADRAVIDRCFAAGSVEAILAALDADGSDFAVRTAAELRQKSPTSLLITHEQLRLGAEVETFAQAMQLEFRIVSRICHVADFYEGVRAAVIDKDGKPRWNPGSIESVDRARVAAHFAPLGAEELVLP